MQSLHDPISIEEVIAIYLPLSRLLALYVAATQGLFKATQRFLGAEDGGKVPYIIGVAGSVAVGKSTTARVLQALLSRWPNTPKVQLVTTDGFLHPNARLIADGLLERKGFPESYDATALIRFLADVKAGVRNVTAPVYSHLVYDVVPGETIVVDRPDILIVEGLNVLLPNRLSREGKEIPFVSDFFDFSVFLDASEKSAGKMVCRALHAPARHRVSRSAQLLHQVRRARRPRGARDGALHLASHKSRKPAREHIADAAARQPQADERSEPSHRTGRAAQVVRRPMPFLRCVALALAVALLSPALASAADAPVCDGRNLLENPAVRPDYAAFADDLVNDEGLLWKIEKEGTRALLPLWLHPFDTG